jgi:16S rRNA (uracil1498-N3)-methyltransferase
VGRAHLAEERMRRLRVAALGSAGQELPLPPADLHHLRTVLRMAPGTRLVVFADGAQAEAELTAGGRLRVLTEARVIPGPTPLHLVFALPKGPPLENVLRMAVEVGATHLHPALSERTVPRGDHAERWQRIVTAAAQQCGRADIPVVAPLRPWAEAARAVGPITRRLALPGAPARGLTSEAAALAVGPEGGLTPGETDLLLAEGWEQVGLGPFVMRVDTAVAVGLALLRGPAQPL